MYDFFKLYRLYVDEAYDESYFGLTGFIVKGYDYIHNIHPSFYKLKMKYFPHDPDAEAPVIFHRTDIVKKRGCFNIFGNDKIFDTFVGDLVQFLGSSHYKAINVLVNQQGLKKFLAKDPYTYTLPLMIYKYSNYLANLGAKGDLMFERRDPVKDKLVDHAYNVWKCGGFGELSSNHRHIGALHSRAKKSNVYGLQVADLLAMPLQLANLERNNLVKGKLKGLNEIIWNAICGGQQKSHESEVKEFMGIKVYIYTIQKG